MALLRIEGFDLYGSQSELAMKYPIGSTGSFGFGAGRIANSCLVMPHNNACQFTISPLPTLSTMVIGFGVKFGGTLSAVPGFVKIRQDGVTHISLNLGATGTISIVAQSTVGTVPTPVLPNVWYYFEIKFIISATAGYIGVNVNGNTSSVVYPCNNYNTLSPTATANQVSFGNLSGTSTDILIDDFYAVDTNTPHGDFLGAVFVQSVNPNGNGNANNWTPVGATQNYQAVNDTAGDNDATYVRATASNSIDLYTFPALTGNNGIVGVDLNYLVRREVGNVPLVAPVVYSGGTNHEGNSASAPSAYNYNSQLYLVDPNTTTAWTKSGVNSSQFGFVRVN